MTVSKVSVDFSTNKYRDEALVVEANNVVEMMTGNSDFPEPSPALTEITTASNVLSNAIAIAKTGSVYDTAVKNEKRKLLESLLKQEATYVQITSSGNEVKILSTGFSVNKKASTVGSLSAPENIKISAGENSGSLKISWSAIKRASANIINYTEAPVSDSSVWLSKTTTKHNIIIDNLTSGKQYAFKIAGIGSDDSRIWSDVIYSYVM